MMAMNNGNGNRNGNENGNLEEMLVEAKKMLELCQYFADQSGLAFVGGFGHLAHRGEGGFSVVSGMTGALDQQEQTIVTLCEVHNELVEAEVNAVESRAETEGQG
jgi:hypothetical protein